MGRYCNYSKRGKICPLIKQNFMEWGITGFYLFLVDPTGTEGGLPQFSERVPESLWGRISCHFSRLIFSARL